MMMRGLLSSECVVRGRRHDFLDKRPIFKYVGALISAGMDLLVLKNTYTLIPLPESPEVNSNK